MSTQVKSKERVADHGEVFTADREVQDMCDLVKQETERIDSREVYMKGIDHSYYYEGYTTFKTEEL